MTAGEGHRDPGNRGGWPGPQPSRPLRPVGCGDWVRLAVGMSIGADTRPPGSVIEKGQIQMYMNTQTKLGLGSAMATVAALGIVLSLLLVWSAAPRPWGFLLGFVFGVLAGLGVTLAVAGLIERRRGP